MAKKIPSLGNTNRPNAGQTPVNKVRPGGGERGLTPKPKVVPPKKKS